MQKAALGEVSIERWLGQHASPHICQHKCASCIVRQCLLASHPLRGIACHGPRGLEAAPCQEQLNTHRQ